jgi:hypothetical protein
MSTEIQVAADVAALRRVCADEIQSRSSTKSVPIGGTNYLAQPPRTYGYCAEAIEQIVSELDEQGWKAERLGSGWVTGVFFLHLEPKTSSCRVLN